MNNNESKEMYLATIYDLHLKNEVVRSVDIARILGYSKPSVARAISKLKKEGYILHQPYEPIILTQKGVAIGKEIKNKHVYLTRFLQLSLRICKELAEKDACRIEHIISNETMSEIVKYVNSNS